MKFLKEKLTEGHPILSSLLSAAVYFIALLGVDLSLRLIDVSASTSPLDGSVPLKYTLCWCFILTAISFILPKTARKIFNIASVSVFTLFALIHEFFYSFFGSYMSFSSVIFAEDGAGFFDWSYFSIPKKFLLALLICVLLAVFSAFLVPKTKYYLVGVIVAMVVFILSTTGINLLSNYYFSDGGGISWSSTQSPLEIYESFTDQFTCMHMVGLYQYSFRDFMVCTGLEDFIDSLSNSSTIAELDNYYESKEIDPDNEMTGIFKGKNLILVQLEAIDSWMLNDTVMPNLSGLRADSIDFVNYYAPKYLWGATFNSENVVNTGMISPMNSSKTSYFDKTDYPYSMANLFTDEGYSANSFHRSNGSIYNRAKVHENWGYAKYNSGADMGLSDFDLDSRLTEAYDMMVSDGKFMSFIITYSGHGPYNRDAKEPSLYYDEIRPLLPADAEEEYICALCNAHETDVFIGNLIDCLEKDGHIDDTVLVFYTDHYDHYITTPEILPKYKETSDTNLMCHIPFFIYCKGSEPVKVEKVVATYDVLPTVVNLFDLPTDGRYYIGNDAFSDNGGYAIFPDKSWIDNDEYFNIYTDSATEKSRERASEINERLNMCWDTVKVNYFKDK